jgi:hypothetical protein
MNTTFRFAKNGFRPYFSLGFGVLAVALAGCAPEASEDDDHYTILLYTHAAPTTHARDAKTHLEKARRYTGWSDLYVISHENESSLYRGRFRTTEDAQGELMESKTYLTPQKIRLFARAHLVRIPGKDIGPPEWSLANAPPEAIYTVQVGVFFNVPDKDYFERKARAVRCCTELRKQNYEAYYYHGQSTSIVTIGLFPETSGKTVYQTLIHPKTGDRSRVEKKIIDDPRIDAIRKDFPDLLICGNTEIRYLVNPETRQLEKVTTKTSAITIPGRNKESHIGRTASPSGYAQPR